MLIIQNSENSFDKLAFVGFENSTDKDDSSIRRGNERNHKCPLSINNSDYNQCNCNGVRSGMTAQCCHQSHICTENLIPKLTLRLWANFPTCSDV